MKKIGIENETGKVRLGFYVLGYILPSNKEEGYLFKPKKIRSLIEFTKDKNIDLDFSAQTKKEVREIIEKKLHGHKKQVYLVLKLDDIDKKLPPPKNQKSIFTEYAEIISNYYCLKGKKSKK
jgi:hypothetical protein